VIDDAIVRLVDARGTRFDTRSWVIDLWLTAINLLPLDALAEQHF
jgi:hypothetical protein